MSLNRVKGEGEDVRTDPEVIQGMDLATMADQYQAEGPEAHLLANIAVWAGKADRLQVDCLVVSNDRDLTFKGTSLLKDLHERAGPELLEECRGLGKREEGEIVRTGSYGLAAGTVLHAISTQGIVPGTIRDCYLQSLQWSALQGLKTIAFDALGAHRAFRCPKDVAAEIAADTVLGWLGAGGDKDLRVILCAKSKE